MNDPGPQNTAKWSGDPQGFRFSFRELRRLMLDKAMAHSDDPGLPPFRFDFSPAIRKDIAGNTLRQIMAPTNPQPVNNYWPGDQFVDLVSCTWYVGNDGSDLTTATNNLSRYLRSYLPRNKPFAMDALGGASQSVQQGPPGHKVTVRSGHVAMIKKLLGQMEDMKSSNASENISFEHVTLFLAGDWLTLEPLKFPA